MFQKEPAWCGAQPVFLMVGLEFKPKITWCLVLDLFLNQEIPINASRQNQCIGMDLDKVIIWHNIDRRKLSSNTLHKKVTNPKSSQKFCKKHHFLHRRPWKKRSSRWVTWRISDQKCLQCKRKKTHVWDSVREAWFFDFFFNPQKVLVKGPLFRNFVSYLNIKSRKISGRFFGNQDWFHAARNGAKSFIVKKSHPNLQFPQV